MGFTVLYIAFGMVALWLLGEALFQYKARLRWRVLAFGGFVCVVAGVALPTMILLGVGVAAFGTGQAFVTLSHKRGFVAGWALTPPAWLPIFEQRPDFPEAAPSLRVSGLDEQYDPPPVATTRETPAFSPADLGGYGYESEPAQQDFAMAGAGYAAEGAGLPGPGGAVPGGSMPGGGAVQDDYAATQAFTTAAADPAAAAQGYGMPAYETAAVGYAQGGYAQGDFAGNAFAGGGFDPQPPQGYGAANGFDQHGFDAQGFGQQGFAAQDFGQFGQPGLGQQGLDQQGFDPNGFDAHGYDSNGFDALGFDAQGLDALGFDAHGPAGQSFGGQSLGGQSNGFGYGYDSGGSGSYVGADGLGYGPGQHEYHSDGFGAVYQPGPLPGETGEFTVGPQRTPWSGGGLDGQSYGYDGQPSYAGYPGADPYGGFTAASYDNYGAGGLDSGGGQFAYDGSNGYDAYGAYDGSNGLGGYSGYDGYNGYNTAGPGHAADGYGSDGYGTPYADGGVHAGQQQPYQNYQHYDAVQYQDGYYYGDYGYG